MNSASLTQQLVSYFPYLAILVPLITMWSQIRVFLAKLVRLFILETQVTGNAARAITFYLKMNAKTLPSNIKKYSSVHEYVVKEKANRLVVYESAESLRNQLYRIGGKIIMLSDLSGENGNSGHKGDMGTIREDTVVIRHLRGTLNIEKMIIDAVDWYENVHKQSDDASKRNSRFYITRLVGQKSSEQPGGSRLGYNDAPQTVKSAGPDAYKFSRLLKYKLEELGYSSKEFFYVFNNRTNVVLNDVKKWLSSKDWYADKGLLWRRGCLLYSKPGTGKSSLIRKVGQACDLPVRVFELSTFTNDHLLKYWEESRNAAPCIVVMEDIDAVFNKRTPVNENCELSFDCLLNCISGVEPGEGIYLFVTANDITKVDDALGVPRTDGFSTRPGRLDSCVGLEDITLEEKRHIANHFLKDWPDEIETLIVEANGCTAAQFTDLCSQRALKHYWEKS